MNKIEVVWLFPFVGAFAGCVSSLLVLVFFWIWRLLSEQSSRKAMTIAAIGGAISGLLTAVLGERVLLITLWRNTFGQWVSLSGNTELLGAAFAAAWPLGGLLALIVALRELLKEKRNDYSDT